MGKIFVFSCIYNNYNYSNDYDVSIYKNEVQANVLYSISLGLAVMNIFVYFLINDIVTSEAKLHEKEILGLQFKNQIDMYRSISENYEIQKKSHMNLKSYIVYRIFIGSS